MRLICCKAKSYERHSPLIRNQIGRAVEALLVITMVVQQFLVGIHTQERMIRALANQHVMLALIVLVGHSQQIVLDSATTDVS